MENTPVKENKMGTEPVAKLLLTMALPIVGSMLAQACYNIVDSIFVSRIDENALSAVSIAFSIQTIMMAIAMGTNTGVNALLSRSLGAKNLKRVNQITQHAIFLAVISAAVITVASIWFVPAFMRAMTTESTTQICDYGISYLRVCCSLCIFMFSLNTMERLLNATGKTHLTMISQLTGAVLNIILDPLMIFGIGPFPKMGVAGAAAATMIAQAVSAVISLVLNITKNKEISLSMKGFRPDLPLIKDIYRIGIPSGAIMVLNSITNIFMNRLLIGFTETAVAVLGVYFKLNTFVFFPIFSLNQACVPIVAFNLGARRKKRITSAIRWTLVFGISVMALGTVIFQIFPAELLGLFDASETMLSIGIPALRTISLMFPFAAMCIILSSAMQALGYAFYSMIAALCRQIVVLIPAAYLLAWLGGLNAIWFAYLIAEGVSLALIAVFFRNVYMKTVAPLPE